MKEFSEHRQKLIEQTEDRITELQQVLKETEEIYTVITDKDLSDEEISILILPIALMEHKRINRQKKERESRNETHTT